MCPAAPAPHIRTEPGEAFGLPPLLLISWCARSMNCVRARVLEHAIESCTRRCSDAPSTRFSERQEDPPGILQCAYVTTFRHR